ncbi:MAG: hypothetical protein ACI4DN_01635 [Lachnospiraceae bacterium]
MKEKKNGENRKKLTQGSLMMRILAGAYLLYLVYQLVRGYPLTTGNSRIVSLVGIVLFSITGILILGHSLYLIKTGRYENNKEKDEDSR